MCTACSRSMVCKYEKSASTWTLVNALSAWRSSLGRMLSITDHKYYHSVQLTSNGCLALSYGLCFRCCSTLTRSSASMSCSAAYAVDAVGWPTIPTSCSIVLLSNRCCANRIAFYSSMASCAIFSYSSYGNTMSWVRKKHRIVRSTPALAKHVPLYVTHTDQSPRWCWRKSCTMVQLSPSHIFTLPSKEAVKA